MKKYIIIAFSIILIIIFLICFKNYTKIKYDIIANGYYENYENVIISTYDDYKKLVNELSVQENISYNFDKYDNKYFENKSLVFLNIKSSSVTNKFKIQLSIHKNKLEYKDLSDSSMLMAMDGRMIFVEVDKNIKQIIFK